MTWNFNNGTRYHTQDTSYYCGAACAMMVLAEIGVPYSKLDQNDLYNSNHSHNAKPNWYTDPVGLQYTLVHRKPASFHNTFVVYKPTTEAEGTRKIVDTLRHYKISPSVLVYGCAHWIVVRGVQTSVDPATGPYSINGFWVNNPVWEDNHPHSATDVCGSGGGHGLANQWISHATWQGTYLTGCPYDSTGGTKQYISVCDPAAPKVQLPREPEIVRLFSGDGVIEARQATGAVKKEIDRFSLSDAKEAARVVKANFSRPLLVKRLDDPRKFYYLVPSMAGEKVVGYAQVDAHYGNLESLFILQRAANPFESNPKAVERQLAGRIIERSGEQGRVTLQKAAFRVEPNLVWKPCRQAYSPHLPFWQITHGSDTFYQRIDGQVFPELTLDGMGI